MWWLSSVTYPEFCMQERFLSLHPLKQNFQKKKLASGIFFIVQQRFHGCPGWMDGWMDG